MNLFFTELTLLLSAYIVVMLIAAFAFKYYYINIVTVRRYFGTLISITTSLLIILIIISFMYSGTQKNEYVEKFEIKEIKKEIITEVKADSINKNSADVKRVIEMKTEQKEDQKKAINELDEFIDNIK